MTGSFTRRLVAGLLVAGGTAGTASAGFTVLGVKVAPPKVTVPKISIHDVKREGGNAGKVIGKVGTGVATGLLGGGPGTSGNGGGRTTVRHRNEGGVGDQEGDKADRPQDVTGSWLHGKPGGVKVRHPLGGATTIRHPVKWTPPAPKPTGPKGGTPVSWPKPPGTPPFHPNPPVIKPWPPKPVLPPVKPNPPAKPTPEQMTHGILSSIFQPLAGQQQGQPGQVIGQIGTGILGAVFNPPPAGPKPPAPTPPAPPYWLKAQPMKR